MFPFIETIAISQYRIPLLNWHQERLNRTFARWYPHSKPHDLKQILSSQSQNVLHKLRFLYAEKEFKVELALYQSPNIQSLKIVTSEPFDYGHKYADRLQLNQLFAKRGQSDDIIIVVDQQPTDSYYANVCYYDGSTWYTSTSYLLNGVMRQYLLEKGRIREKNIQVHDIRNFEKVSLINALNPLGNIEIDISKIVW